MKQLVVSSIKEVIDKIESVTDAVKQWWLPRASLNEELIDTSAVHPGLKAGSQSHPGQVYAQSISFRYMCYELASN